MTRQKTYSPSMEAVLQPTYAHRSSRIYRPSELSRYQASSTYRDARRRASWRLIRQIMAVWAAGAVLFLILAIWGA